MVMEVSRKVSLIIPILPRDIQADNNVALMTGSKHCFSFPPRGGERNDPITSKTLHLVPLFKGHNR